MCSLLQGWRGREFFGAGSWWYLYKLPIEKRTADLQWTNLFAQCPHLDILFELLKT